MNSTMGAGWGDRNNGGGPGRWEERVFGTQLGMLIVGKKGPPFNGETTQSFWIGRELGRKKTRR